MSRTGSEHRHVLYNILARRGKGPILAAEIGVASGETSQFLLERLPNLWLVMVDSWLVPDHKTRKTQGACDTACRLAIERTKPYADRRIVIHQDSLSAAAALARIGQWHGGFDLVFIDADHRYGAVAADCEAWWPMVCSGGILCGHDYDSPRNASGGWGVDRAVNEFAGQRGLLHSVEKSVWIIEKPRSFID